MCYAESYRNIYINGLKTLCLLKHFAKAQMLHIVWFYLCHISTRKIFGDRKRNSSCQWLLLNKNY